MFPKMSRNNCKVLLCYNERKKIATLQDDHQGSSALQQITAVANKFCSNPILQYYDDDFKELVEVTDDYVPRN